VGIRERSKGVSGRRNERRKVLHLLWSYRNKKSSALFARSYSKSGCNCNPVLQHLRQRVYVNCYNPLFTLSVPKRYSYSSYRGYTLCFQQLDWVTSRVTKALLTVTSQNVKT